MNDYVRRTFGSASHVNPLWKENEMVECPECAASIAIGPDVEEGEILVCPDCGVELEVLKLNPLTLGLAPQEAEDWGE
jgi:alpha-aminoadipate carrier protein LysW